MSGKKCLLTIFLFLAFSGIGSSDSIKDVKHNVEEFVVQMRDALTQMQSDLNNFGKYMNTNMKELKNLENGPAIAVPFVMANKKGMEVVEHRVEPLRPPTPDFPETGENTFYSITAYVADPNNTNNITPLTLGISTDANDTVVESKDFLQFLKPEYWQWRFQANYGSHLSEKSASFPNGFPYYIISKATPRPATDTTEQRALTMDVSRKTRGLIVYPQFYDKYRNISKVGGDDDTNIRFWLIPVTPGKKDNYYYIGAANPINSNHTPVFFKANLTAVKGERGLLTQEVLLAPLDKNDTAFHWKVDITH